MVRGYGYVILSLVMLMLSACIPDGRPILGNALDVNLEITVSYSDGHIMNHTWAPNTVLAIGGARDGAIRTTQEVIIKEAGQILHQFNYAEVRLLFEKQDAHPQGLWCVDRETLYLFEPDPPFPQGCSKGKRIN